MYDLICPFGIALPAAECSIFMQIKICKLLSAEFLSQRHALGAFLAHFRRALVQPKKVHFLQFCEIFAFIKILYSYF